MNRLDGMFHALFPRLIQSRVSLFENIQGKVYLQYRFVKCLEFYIPFANF